MSLLGFLFFVLSVLGVYPDPVGVFSA